MRREGSAPEGQCGRRARPRGTVGPPSCWSFATNEKERTGARAKPMFRQNEREGHCQRNTRIDCLASPHFPRGRPAQPPHGPKQVTQRHWRPVVLHGTRPSFGKRAPRAAVCLRAVPVHRSDGWTRRTGIGGACRGRTGARPRALRKARRGLRGAPNEGAVGANRRRRCHAGHRKPDRPPNHRSKRGREGGDRGANISDPTKRSPVTRRRREGGVGGGRGGEQLGPAPHMSGRPRALFWSAFLGQDIGNQLQNEGGVPSLDGGGGIAGRRPRAAQGHTHVALRTRPVQNKSPARSDP